MDNKPQNACTAAVVCSGLSWLLSNLEQHAAVYSLLIAALALLIQIISTARKERRESRKELREIEVTAATIAAIRQHGVNVEHVNNGNE